MPSSTTHRTTYLVCQAAAASRPRVWVRFVTALLRALSVAAATMRPGRFLCALLTVSLLTIPVEAENKPRPKIRPDLVPGYRIQTIQGFTVLVSAETVKHANDKAYERKPLEVLELELTRMVRMMPASAVKVLRQVPIWAEWDEQRAMSNGRAENALAVYQGGHQLSMLLPGDNPLKAKSVVIYRLKSLTEEHQPKRESGRCVLLHEMAHGVHIELLGANNEYVKAIYKQAMERRLYDSKMYASTNELEFFAELTCAYYGQFQHYPHNRTELKKHDRATYDFMVTVWGKGGPDGTMPSGNKPAGDSTLQLDQIDIGSPVLGPVITKASAQGKPIVVLYWNAASADSVNCLVKLSAVDTALSDFGLLMVGVHLTGSSKQDIAGAARARAVRFSISEGKWTNHSLVKDFKEFPLCLVFDHEGRCIYRGTPFEVESAARMAVGRALAATLKQGDLPKLIQEQVEYLAKGSTPSSVLPRLSFLARTSNREVAEPARQLLDAITAGGRKKLLAAEALTKEDPVAAYLILKRISAVYKDTPLSDRATALVSRLSQNKAVQIEERAGQYLRVVVSRLDSELRSRPGAFAPTSEMFRSANAALLRQLQDALQHMKKLWPKARATEEAIGIGQAYGLAVR
jgi:hypothetical protein